MSTASTSYTTFTEATFRSDVLDSSEPVLVDFWAEWCGPCHVMAPVIDELAAEFAGRVTVGKVNVDEQLLELTSEGTACGRNAACFAPF